MRSRCPLILAAAWLALVHHAAQAADVPSSALGAWHSEVGGAPVEIDIDADGLVVRSHDRIARFFAVDYSATCFSGATRDSSSFCVSPVLGQQWPFTLVFNADEQDGVVRLDVNGRGEWSPWNGTLWHR